MSFVRGNIIFIPTAASENAINASWLIILGVRNEGLGVPCSTCSIWNIGFLPWVLVLESCLHCSCLLYIRHLIFCEFSIFLPRFPFIFGVYFSLTLLATLCI